MVQDHPSDEDNGVAVLSLPQKEALTGSFEEEEEKKRPPLVIKGPFRSPSLAASLCK